MDGMKIEMRRFPFRVSIVSRILDRRKIVNFHIVRHNDNPARMLPGRSFYTSQALNKPIDFSAAKLQTFVVLIAFYESVCRFFSNGADRSSTIHMFFPEQFFRIVMCTRLVFY